ncbi:MAG: DnaJ domain-containing protein, partial [Pseudorhodoplanes sp.]
ADLPPGVSLIIRIAGGDADAEKEALAQCRGRPIETIREAACFYIAQVLFDPRSDAYRTLGLDCYATREELRSNMALLLRWLHPDKDAGGENAIFIGRIINAWDMLKSEAKRTDYDLKLQEAKHTSAPLSSRRVRRRNQSRSRLLTRLALERMAVRQPTWRQKLLKPVAACAIILAGTVLVGEYATGSRAFDAARPYVEAVRQKFERVFAGTFGKDKASGTVAQDDEVQISHEQNP